MTCKSLYVRVSCCSIKLHRVDNRPKLLQALELNLPGFNDAGQTVIESECGVRQLAESVALLKERKTSRQHLL